MLQRARLDFQFKLFNINFYNYPFFKLLISNLFRLPLHNLHRKLLMLLKYYAAPDNSKVFSKHKYNNRAAARVKRIKIHSLHCTQWQHTQDAGLIAHPTQCFPQHALCAAMQYLAWAYSLSRSCPVFVCLVYPMWSSGYLYKGINYALPLKPRE